MKRNREDAGVGAESAESKDKKLTRTERKAKIAAKLLGAFKSQTVGAAAVETPAVASSHPFEVDPSDHAETPFEAYRGEVGPI